MNPLESPWPALVIGIVVETLLAIALVKTGRGVLLAWMAGVALLVLGAVVVERMVVTDKKLVKATLYEAAAALEADDLDRLLACISPDAGEVRARARWALDEFKFSQVQLRDLDPEIRDLASPPTATVKFVVLATGKVRSGAAEELTQPVRLKVTLERKSGRWLIVDGKPEEWAAQ